KPSNVLLSETNQVRVTDFGLGGASGTDSESGGVSAVAGTPPYMAPEQLAGRAGDALSDQWSFCVSLYEGLYGERPFAGKTLLEVERAIAMGPPPPPRSPRLPAWLREVVMRGLSPARERRFPTMDALLRALGRDATRTRRRRWLVAAGAVALGLVGFAGFRYGEARPKVLCRGAPQRLTEVWGGPSKQALASACGNTQNP